jgi:hypothetical protein
MGRRKKFVMPKIAEKFVRQDSAILPSGHLISKGEMFKIKGKNDYGTSEYGLTFKFDCLVTNTETGKQWVECFEMFKMQAGAMRSFPLDRIKRMPTRRKYVRRAKTD